MRSVKTVKCVKTNLQGVDRVVRYDITDLGEIEDCVRSRGIGIEKHHDGDRIRVVISVNGNKIREIRTTLLEYYIYLRGLLDGLESQGS